MPVRPSFIDSDADDLLKELDDLPGGGASSKQRAAQNGRPPPAAGPSASPHLVSRSSAGNLSTPSTSASPAAASSNMSSSGRAAGLPADASPHLRHAASALDKLLDDFDDLDLPSSSSSSSRPPPAAAARSNPGTSTLKSTATAKCMGLFIGGSNKPRGRNGSAVGTLLCCDSLRCTKCDFKVSWFFNQEWDASVDYLFFRNNFPTESKLAPKLLRQQGSCAYCCQCSWQSSTAEARVDFGGDLRWVCAGHSME